MHLQPLLYLEYDDKTLSVILLFSLFSANLLCRHDYTPAYSSTSFQFATVVTLNGTLFSY